MGSQLSIDPSVHVVIVGGGFGGITAGQHLKHQGVPFMLIDPSDAFHHNVAALRASVQSDFARKTFIPYKETFGLSFLQGRVIQINMLDHFVVLDNGKEVTYSHLIICTGSDGPFPTKCNAEHSYQKAIEMYEDIVKKVQAVDSVLVIGGGATGVEMAAEIRTEFPNKKVILIHPRETLADPELLSSVREEAKQILLEKGVELCLGQKVSNLDELELNVTRKGSVVKTDKNEQFTVDLVFSCMGNKINSSAYKSSLVNPGVNSLPYEHFGLRTTFFNLRTYGQITDYEQKFAKHVTSQTSSLQPSLSLCIYSEPTFGQRTVYFRCFLYIL
ncbi:apoptosis-inducing factor 2 isoform X2 [Trichomycterus rosablanca]|uniref:apoptosis-inducing factor 2 isoform X2 n=1 Tax=Trichomycterus rosablanca TaxID=2290929 RepID=UPI002F35218A